MSQKIKKQGSLEPLNMDSLTGLRFFAAFHVVGFHCWYWTDWTSLRFVAEIFGSGYVSVSLFYILSGFILTYNYQSVLKPSAVRFGAFFQARVARVYPVYALGLLAASPFFAVTLVRALDAGGLPEGLARGLAVLLLVQAWHPEVAMDWNPPAWSLSCEMFFYALFPLAAALLARIPQRGIVPALVVVWLLSLVPGLVYIGLEPDGLGVTNHASEGFWLNAVKYHPLLRFPEFVIGILLGRQFLFHVESGKSGRTVVAQPWAAGPILAYTAVALLLGILVLHRHLPYPLLHNSLLSPLYAALIYTLPFTRGLLGSLLAHRAVVLLGGASYALYILHSPLQSLLSAVSKRLGVADQSQVYLVVIYTLVMLLASVAVFRYFEEPSRRWVRGKLSRSKPSQ